MRKHPIFLATSLFSACVPTAPDGTGSGAAESGSVSDDGGDTTGAELPTEVRMVVGPQGGVVEGLGLRLDIPVDALTEDVETRHRKRFAAPHPATRCTGIGQQQPDMALARHPLRISRRCVRRPNASGETSH